VIDPLKISKMATAIAKAEGFFVPGSLPARCHNPGDLEIGDVGYGVDDGKTKFKDDNDGWMRLRHQCDLILSQLSGAGYKLSDTWWQVAVRWTGNDAAANWALSVAQSLGMSATNTLQDYLNKA
jgi:hypothetical protein